MKLMYLIMYSGINCMYSVLTNIFACTYKCTDHIYTEKHSKPLNTQCHILCYWHNQFLTHKQLLYNSIEFFITLYNYDT